MNRIFYLVIALMLLAVTCAFAEDASSMLTDSVLDGALLIEDSF